MTDDHLLRGRSSRTALLWGILGLLVAAASLGLAEIGLRLIGFEPWRPSDLSEQEPATLESDAVLGWKNRPGRYLVPAYSSAGHDVRISIDQDGARVTSPHENNKERKVVMVGGSYTFGWAVSDEETYAWKLQESHEDWQIINYGTGGYGTYQSLLLLQQFLEDIEEPALVLYGFISEHEVRNVATASWLDLLNKISHRGHTLDESSHRGDIAVPYVTVGGEATLIYHEPAAWIGLPLRQSLAIVNLFDVTWQVLESQWQSLQKQKATELLLLEMDRSVHDHGSEFAVVLLDLDGQAKEEYQQFLTENRVHSLDCAFGLTDEFRVPGDGHPNGAMHSRWAECIGDALGELESLD